MTPLQASLSLAQFDDVECLTARRIAAAERYHEGLKNIEQIGLPPLCTDGSHIYWYYPIHYSQRHELVRFAMQRGSDIAESYHRNCADLNCFREFSRDCKNAKITAESIIYLPTYPRFTDREIDKVIATIKQYFGAIGD